CTSSCRGMYPHMADEKAGRHAIRIRDASNRFIRPLVYGVVMSIRRQRSRNVPRSSNRPRGVYRSHLLTPPWSRQASCWLAEKLNVPSAHSAVAPLGTAFEFVVRLLWPKKPKK